jgi:TRAP-type C4-dicarboxylate transport system permease small subunit
MESGRKLFIALRCLFVRYFDAMQTAQTKAGCSGRIGLHRLLTLFELGLAAAAIILLVLCSLAIIVLRSLSESAASVSVVDWLSPYPSHLMLVAGLLGGSLALSRGEALKIEALNGFLSETKKKSVARIVSAIGLAFYLGFLVLAVGYLTVDYRPVVAFVYLPLFCLIGLKLILVGFSTQK